MKFYKAKKFDLKQENSMEKYLILVRSLNIYSENAITGGGNEQII